MSRPRRDARVGFIIGMGADRGGNCMPRVGNDAGRLSSRFLAGGGRRSHGCCVSLDCTRSTVRTKTKVVRAFFYTQGATIMGTTRTRRSAQTNTYCTRTDHPRRICAWRHQPDRAVACTLDPMEQCKCLSGKPVVLIPRPAGPCRALFGPYICLLGRFLSLFFSPLDLMTMMEVGQKHL
jgi:hypothetical protein